MAVYSAMRDRQTGRLLYVIRYEDHRPDPGKDPHDTLSHRDMRDADVAGAHRSVAFYQVPADAVPRLIRELYGLPPSGGHYPGVLCWVPWDDAPWEICTHPVFLEGKGDVFAG